MIKEWANDIKTKTKNMTREETAEYIAAYYWYHILIAVLLLGFAVLVVYHIGWGKKETEFSLVIVNQDVNFSRDAVIQNAFSEASGIKSSRILVDSDYLISYGDKKLEGINESHYEKFFFNWSAREIDAVIMPQSFYEYCKTQAGTFLELEELTGYSASGAAARISGSAGDSKTADGVFQDQGKNMGVYVSETKIASCFLSDGQDPFILVFPKDMKHTTAGGRFLEYVLS